MSGDAIHLIPRDVTEYADGFTAAHGTACGWFWEGRGEVGGDAINTALRPYAVTCPACLASPAYKSVLQAYEGRQPTPYHITRVNGLAHQVYRRRGLYDVIENNRLREWLGLPAVFAADELKARLLAERDQVQEDYDNRRARNEQVDAYTKENGLGRAVTVIRSYDVLTGEETEEIILDATGQDERGLPKPIAR